jgi:hypothetical protein
MTALFLNNLAWWALKAGDPVEARAKLVESLELARQIDDTCTIASVTGHLGWAALLEGDLESARLQFREEAAISRHVGRRALLADAIWGLAQTAAAGDPDRAARLGGAAFALGAPAGYDPLLESNTLVDHYDRAGRPWASRRGKKPGPREGSSRSTRRSISRSPCSRDHDPGGRQFEAPS